MTTIFIKGQSVASHYDNRVMHEAKAAAAKAQYARAARMRGIVNVALLASVAAASAVTCAVMFFAA